MGEEANFHKLKPKLLTKRKVLSHCKEREAPVEFVSTVEGH